MALKTVRQGLTLDSISNNVVFNQPVVGFSVEGGYELRFKDLKPVNGAFIVGGNANTRTYIQSFSNGTISVTKGNPGVGGSSFSAPLLDSLEHTASLFWKNGTYYFYVDGTLVESLAFSDTTTNGDTVRLGCHTGGTGPFAAFTALQFRQYNRLLTSTEIASNHTSQVTRNGLVGEWLLNEGTGTVATDTSGNGNNGTINGATWLIKKAPVKGKKNFLQTTSYAVNGAPDTAAVDFTTPTQLVNGGTYTASGYWAIFPDDVSTNDRITITFYYADNSFTNITTAFNSLPRDGAERFQTVTATADPAKILSRVRLWNFDYSTGGAKVHRTSRNVMFCLGTSTDYEPYIPVTDAKPMPQKPKKNLLPPFTDSAWTLHENTRMQVADFSGKVAGSTVESPHIGKGSIASSLQSPASFSAEMDTIGYTALGILNGVNSVTSSSTNAAIAQQLFSFNVVEHIARKFGDSVFGNARTLAERVAWVKAGNVAKLGCNWNGFGSGPLGNKASISGWNGSSWVLFDFSTLGTVTKKSMPTSNTNLYVQADGFMHILAYADASDGVTASAINTDKVELEVYLTEAAYAPLRQATSLGLNATANFQISYVDVPCVGGQPYTVSLTNDASGNTFLKVESLNASGGIISGLKDNSSKTATVTPELSAVKLRFTLYVFNNTGQFTFDKPQLELGSVATSFEIYTPVTSAKIEPTRPKKNKVPTDPTAWTVSTNTVYCDIPLPDKNSFTISSRGAYDIGVDQKDAGGTTLLWSGYSGLATIVPNALTVSLRVWVKRWDGALMQQSEIALAQPQVEVGSTATVYEPYMLVTSAKLVI